MEWLTYLSEPTVLLFFVIIVGYCVGRIRIRNISLDLSAILIFAVIVGYLLSAVVPQTIDTDFENTMSLFSKLGTALFVSAIGLASGNSVAQGFNKSNFVSLLIGAGMVVMAIITTKIIGLLDDDMDTSLLLGILCGAITTTPGLSAVCEAPGVVPELAVLGYSCSYLFGVIGVVMFVQLMTRKAKDQPATESQIRKTTKSHMKCLVPIGLSVAVGTICGSIEFAFADFSLGTSGGILCVAIAIGLVIGRRGKEIHPEKISCYRNFGLMMFFVGSGIPAGIELTSAFDVKWFVYGVILTAVPILCGYLLSYLVFKKKLSSSMCIVAGGMTSTPAIGVLLRNPKLSLDLSAYSFAYIGALLTIVITQ